MDCIEKILEAKSALERAKIVKSYYNSKDIADSLRGFINNILQKDAAKV